MTNFAELLTQIFICHFIFTLFQTLNIIIVGIICMKKIKVLNNQNDM